MVACGDADAMVTGNTRRYGQSLQKITKVIPPRPGGNNVWLKHGCKQR